jgi:ComF family protein
VHALKYEGWPELADFMGRAMAAAIASPSGGDVGGAPSVVVPMPTTRERLRRRGYNQAELLARRVSDLTRLPLVAALARSGSGRSQTGLTPTERAENVRGVFRPAQGRAGVEPGVHVVLVDDVLTTGATASEAASVLAGMGSARVTLVTYARALADAPEKAP